MRWVDPCNESTYFEAVLDGETVGLVDISAPTPASPEYATNKHLIWSEGGVLAPFRRRGVATALLSPVAEYMRERGATVFGTWSEEPDQAGGFMRWLGADQKFTGHENRLDLNTLDWAMVEAWAREGEAGAGATRLEMYEPRLPEEMLEDYCPAYSAMLNTVPFEEMDHGDEILTPEALRLQYALAERLGSVHHLALTREPDGTMSGMTEVIYHPYQPDRVHQELTAVHTSQRGRGLGKWLKAATLRRVRQAHPEVRLVTTENAGSNAAMLAINTKLGFRPNRRQIVYQMSLERLTERLALAASAR